MSTLAWSVLWAALAGALGGFTARVLPRGTSKVDVPGAPAEAGWLVSTLVGALAGVVALLGTDDYAKVILLGPGPGPDWHLTFGIADLVRAFAVGLVGLKWLVNYQDSRTLRVAVAEAAGRPPSVEVAAAAASAQPREVLRAARGG
jgi:hypothetical protein